MKIVQIIKLLEKYGDLGMITSKTMGKGLV